MYTTLGMTILGLRPAEPREVAMAHATMSVGAVMDGSLSNSNQGSETVHSHQDQIQENLIGRVHPLWCGEP